MVCTNNQLCFVGKFFRLYAALCAVSIISGLLVNAIFNSIYNRVIKKYQKKQLTFVLLFMVIAQLATCGLILYVYNYYFNKHSKLIISSLPGTVFPALFFGVQFQVFTILQKIFDNLV